MRSIALALAFFALPAHAILIRADRDDAEYVEMATRYGSSIWIEPIASGGALIAARWILTDGASAKRLDEMRPRPALRIGASEVRVQEVFVPVNERLALVLLASPVKGVTPSAIYRGDDEKGKTVVIAGFGPSGAIGAGAPRRDGKARAGVNTVEDAQPLTLALRIKPPDDASDLQGAAVDGDRGSPLYIDNEDGVFVAGIAASSQPAAEFGAANVFQRVSTAARWIEETMLEQAKREMDGLLNSAGS